MLKISAKVWGPFLTLIIRKLNLITASLLLTVCISPEVGKNELSMRCFQTLKPNNTECPRFDSSLFITTGNHFSNKCHLAESHAEPLQPQPCPRPAIFSCLCCHEWFHAYSKAGPALIFCLMSLEATHGPPPCPEWHYGTPGLKNATVSATRHSPHHAIMHVPATEPMP